MPPRKFNWFELIEYYAFRLFLLGSFLFTLWKIAKHELGL